MYQTHIAYIGELKHRLVQVWAELDHRHITAAIRQRRRRLNAYDWVYNCDSAMFCALHDQLASLDMHAQLTRNFNFRHNFVAVAAELLT